MKGEGPSAAVIACSKVSSKVSSKVAGAAASARARESHLLPVFFLFLGGGKGRRKLKKRTETQESRTYFTTDFNIEQTAYRTGAWGRVRVSRVWQEGHAKSSAPDALSTSCKASCKVSRIVKSVVVVVVYIYIYILL
jgi:hypothetical protein